MNITDLIVEFIQQGNVVEFPGMGTLTSNNVNAYHDTATSTYYPARRTVVMTETLAGNKAVVRRIAERECVTNEIAEQMWSNYVAALKEKLQRTPKGHEFPGLGCLRLSGSKVVFDALEGLDLDAGKKHEQPLENVATYTPKTTEDPFAAFEKVVEPKPPVAEAPKQEPVAEPEKKAPAEEPVVVVPAPEPEVVAAAAATAAVSSADHLSEVKRMLDEIPASPKSAKEIRRAEKAAAKAEKEARKAAEEAEKAERARAREMEDARRAAEEAEKALAKEREQNALKAAKEREKAERAALKQQKAEKKERKEKKEKKNRHIGLWLLLLLLLLLIGAAIYYFTQVYQPAPKNESCAQDVTLSYRDQFTDDYALLKFNEQDIRKNAGLLHNFMADYVKSFLVGRHYGNAFAAVMNQVDSYADSRLHELMVEGYCVKRFFPYEDFWLERNYGEYKDAGAHYYRCMVQKELMDFDLLDGILDDVVMNLGLHADGYGYGYGANGGNGAAGGQGRGGAARTVSDKPYEEVVPEAPTFKDSKQGFDIIAGFFTSKKSANKCANQLKALGSDAYIISKSGGYYVSMGSAPTRTAAEAMEKHIKSWYKSDVKIYNFNE